MKTGAPQRFSEASFRRYEASIESVLKHWPTPVTFDPIKVGLSLETFTCRLRDAITGCLRYQYSSMMFDYERLATLSEQIVVAQRDGKVVVGPREALRSFQVQPIRAISTPQSNDCYQVANPSREVFLAFCLLLSQRLLARPLLVQVLDPQLLLEAQQKYDIDASLQDDGSTLII
jgi:hypothetical protein